MKSNDSKNKQKNNHSPFSRYKTMAEDDVALQILNIIEQNPRVSQRKITVQTGVAAGLVHSFMSRVINKGWVRAKQVSAKRWLYFLTPKGFIEKSQLSVNYLSRTLKIYRATQRIVHKKLNDCIQNDQKDMVVVGESELAEICALNIMALKGINLVAVIAENNTGAELLGKKVQPYDTLPTIKYDKLWVCDTGFQQWHKSQKGLKIKKKLIIDLVEILGASNFAASLEESADNR